MSYSASEAHTVPVHDRIIRVWTIFLCNLNGFWQFASQRRQVKLK